MRTGGRFDVVGAAGLSVALVCLLLAISKGAQWGWGSGLTLAMLGTAGRRAPGACAALVALAIAAFLPARREH